MKEKLKKFGKWFLIMTVLLLVIHEIYGLTIDIYNFRQLEKVKIILKDWQVPQILDKGII